MMNTTSTATDAQIEQLRRRAVNDTTREIAAHGIRLTHEQADDLGEEVLGWMVARLEMGRVSDEDGIAFYADEESPTATHAQIVALRLEAIEAGDDMQLALCERALDPDDAEWHLARYIEERLGDAQAQQIRRTTQTEARVECARVIAEARSQAVRS